jgi:hypothetical protein
MCLAGKHRCRSIAKISESESTLSIDPWQRIPQSPATTSGRSPNKRTYNCDLPGFVNQFLGYSHLVLTKSICEAVWYINSWVRRRKTPIGSNCRLIPESTHLQVGEYVKGIYWLTQVGKDEVVPVGATDSRYRSITS